MFQMRVLKPDRRRSSCLRRVLIACRKETGVNTETVTGVEAILGIVRCFDVKATSTVERGVAKRGVSVGHILATHPFLTNPGIDGNHGNRWILSTLSQPSESYSANTKTKFC